MRLTIPVPAQHLQVDLQVNIVGNAVSVWVDPNDRCRVSAHVFKRVEGQQCEFVKSVHNYDELMDLERRINLE